MVPFQFGTGQGKCDNDKALHVYYFVYSQQSCEVSIIPILQMRKLRRGAMKDIEPGLSLRASDSVSAALLIPSNFLALHPKLSHVNSLIPFMGRTPTVNPS